MNSVLGQADEEFAERLHKFTDSILLFRITGAHDKGAELSFLSDVIRVVVEEFGTASELASVNADLETILTGNEVESVGSLYSSLTSVVDRLGSRELYSLMTEFRKEPIRSAPPDDAETLSDYSEELSAKQSMLA
ncbi:MAG: hypothetical protein JRN20_04000 [Nitrososphaerota archaeon]|nr:hypothetical protein [Nitrososphaerota archaeon]MDG6922649.1 hypothetical protein [Nitrososphaerota archaeon]